MLKVKIVEILHFLCDKDFQTSFWSGVLSSLITTFIVALVVNRFSNLFKSPKLRLVVKQEGIYKDKIVLTKRDDGDYEASFHFAIRNDGKLVLKPEEGYWHTYILDENSQSPFSVPGEKNHQRDLIRDFVYPKSFTDIGHEWKFHIKKEKVKNANVPYFFSSPYGYFPKRVKMNPATGVILFTDMGEIGYELAV